MDSDVIFGGIEPWSKLLDRVLVQNLKTFEGKKGGLGNTGYECLHDRIQKRITFIRLQEL